MASNNITIKVNNSGDIRRFTLDSDNAPALYQKISDLFAEQQLTLKYTDDEGDSVTLQTPEDAVEAFSVASASGGTLRVEAIPQDPSLSDEVAQCSSPVSKLLAFGKGLGKGMHGKGKGCWGKGKGKGKGKKGHGWGKGLGEEATDSDEEPRCKGKGKGKSKGKGKRLAALTGITEDEARDLIHKAREGDEEARSELHKLKQQAFGDKSGDHHDGHQSDEGHGWGKCWGKDGHRQHWLKHRAERLATEMQISADDASKLIEQAQQGNEQACEKLQQFKQSKVAAALKITTEEAAALMTKARDGDTEARRAIKRARQETWHQKGAGLHRAHRAGMWMGHKIRKMIAVNSSTDSSDSSEPPSYDSSEPPSCKEPADEVAVKQLIDLGFTADQTQTALLLHGNDVGAAVEWILVNSEEAQLTLGADNMTLGADEQPKSASE